MFTNLSIRDTVFKNTRFDDRLFQSFTRERKLKTQQENICLQVKNGCCASRLSLKKEAERFKILLTYTKTAPSFEISDIVNQMLDQTK